MFESIRILIDEPSKTGEARRRARHMAADMGLDQTTSEQVGIVVTEACTNVLKHARQGELILHSLRYDQDTPPVFELLALDRGPGMADLPRCLEDGYSTAGTSGNGLGAVLRLTKHADFYSHPGLGTGILARWWDDKSYQPPSHSTRFRTAAVSVAKPGQDVCGDTWTCIQLRDRLAILVADGLGHGLDASLASSRAARVLNDNPELDPREILELCHRALRGTRGAAVAVALIDKDTVAFAGVGNIAARIYSSSHAQHLVSVNGTAGHQAERLREFRYPWPDGALLQLNSDGLSTGAALDPYPGLALHDPALIAGILYRDFTRGRDDATVVVAKAA